jgi:hypothetical protein
MGREKDHLEHFGRVDDGLAKNNLVVIVRQLGSIQEWFATEYLQGVKAIGNR